MILLILLTFLNLVVALRISRATFTGMPLLEPNQPPVTGQVTFIQGLPNESRTLVIRSMTSGLLDLPVYQGQTEFFMQVVRGRTTNICPPRDDAFSFLGEGRRLAALPSGATAPDQFFVIDLDLNKVPADDASVVVVRSRGGAGALIACTNLEVVF